MSRILTIKSKYIFNAQSKTPKHPNSFVAYCIKVKKQSIPNHIFVYFVLFYFLCYNHTYHSVSNIATIFWVTVSAYSIQFKSNLSTFSVHFQCIFSTTGTFSCYRISTKSVQNQYILDISSY